LKQLSIKINTALSLGVFNIVKVIIYRMQCRAGYFQRRLPARKLIDGPMFKASEQIDLSNISQAAKNKIQEKANQIVDGQFTFFSHAVQHTGFPPDWFLNPLNNRFHAKQSVYWSCANDENVGDIKIIWELSRMDWALSLTKMAVLTQDSNYLDILNQCLQDWSICNPPQIGPNWMCAQECAIRMIQIILCAHISGQQNPLPSLIDFVQAHCERMMITRHYAEAQNNNHAISEAAGLFIGGLWLEFHNQYAGQWHKTGRKSLEKLCQKLIGDDGSFSQHSLNYHRLMIATITMAEYFRQKFNRPSFSNRFYQKVTKAISWQYQMVDPLTGQGPNLGANDGARVYALTESCYTDFRPEIQLASCLFDNKRLYESGPWDESFEWLQLDSSKYPQIGGVRQSMEMPDGGYVVISKKSTNTWGLVRCPNNAYRPHHADALHFDFWKNGINILRDGGTFSYAQSEPLRSYFASSAAHNTAAFDNHDQMPVLSRFLFGQWITTQTIQPISTVSGVITWTGAYIDYKKCHHQRHICVNNERWHIIDTLNGFNNHAFIRWRLIADHWQLTANCLTGSHCKIVILANVKAEIKLLESLESRFYMHKTITPLLEIRVTECPARVETMIEK